MSRLSVEEGFDLSQDTKFRVQVFPDGTVFWGPSMKWRTYCEVNLLHFPYDVQTCNISFINWIYAEQGTVFHPTQTEVINSEKNHFTKLINASIFKVAAEPVTRMESCFRFSYF